MVDFDSIKTPEELLEYMSKNINYGFLGKNGVKYFDMYCGEWDDWHDEYFLQTAEEIIDSRIGTCWDQVELERDWFNKNNYNYKTIFSWFEHGRDDDMPTHTFLLFEKDNKWYWFENAFESCRGIHEFNSFDNAVEFVKKMQFSYALTNNENTRKTDGEYLVCYEYDKPKDNIGVDDYFNHVTQKRINKKK